jgi:hypothetical protein
LGEITAGWKVAAAKSDRLPQPDTRIEIKTQVSNAAIREDLNKRASKSEISETNTLSLSDPS